MRPRFPIRRILLLRPFRPPNSPRPFTQNTLSCQSRPQLPFLSARPRKPTARFLTTERKDWIKDEVWKAGKYTAVLWTGGFLMLVLVFGVQQEYLNHKYPSPSEWSWITKKDWRNAKCNEDQEEEGGVGLIDWARTGGAYRHVLRRLEDPNIDGAGLVDTDEGGILVAGIGRTGYDITGKSEPWRRGYYEVLMGAARAAEHLDGYVRDRTRNIAFPANVVIGPSNPNPRPVPPGSQSAPREEDCEAAFEGPEVYYMRVLTTQGFTDKQRIDAALAYAIWLDYKKTPEASLEMHKWALDIAVSKSEKPAIDPATGVIKADSGLPSANILSVATALGIHHAVNSNLTLALPIFLSVLRARRSLPEISTTMRSTLTPDEEQRGLLNIARDIIRSTITPPQYPPPPDDGTAPPLRTPKERCEEAGIMTYIGEVLYASKSTKTSREDGLAWTREAVDLAEEELRRKGVDKDAKTKCKQCLEVGLGNWMTMVGKMAREEKETKDGQSSGWLGFGGEKKDTVGRWESEEQVIIERMRRASDILDPVKSRSALSV
ncbi:hypothetical protein ONS95_006427 [Cadophora gregata]|uniref:uncharacterized protein n=1 Tax=Cadophora gregata TaxID=51156 RepID=UPI0026DAE6CC|nr:uncharacterized protein ONS95_006427 [Cadophora gregata]KAK0101248.1 hypothetical protein ONS95_006427 [Cadophora gregata]KAK0106739.1 hypothetical protein ONS96_004357 [Cadophora gregata f. sp. sojae]